MFATTDQACEGTVAAANDNQHAARSQPDCSIDESVVERSLLPPRRYWLLMWRRFRAHLLAPETPRHVTPHGNAAHSRSGRNVAPADQKNA